MLDYFSLINKYYQSGTITYRIFVVHAVLVTNKALTIARKLNLTNADLQFIEEAAMLHDLGVFQTNSPKMDCRGDQPYIAHGYLGAQLLRAENLPQHALVAERHVGVGLTKKEIETRQLPLPPQDFLPTSLPEQIITYADLFFSKRETTLWQEETAAQIVVELSQYGSEQVKIFKNWQQQFGT